MKIAGNIVDIHNREIYKGVVEYENGVIISISRQDNDSDCFIMPGFVDAHVHIESSMLRPRNFGNMVIRYGTVAVVTDPHEIANVMGQEGIQFMMDDARQSPIKTFFTIPSCVPATPFDATGGVITAEMTEQMARSGQFVGLSEMMNVPGVLYGDREVMAKIEAAKKYNLPLDGHAPLLEGEDLKKYAASGITTDHETVSLQEAKQKIDCGLKIIIREGSAVLNFEALHQLLDYKPEMLMFCTDDAHPDDIIALGHIDKLVRRALVKGYDLFDVLRIASLNPVTHYSLDVGLLRVGDKADFIVIDNLKDLNIKEVYINGDRWQESTERSEAEQVVLNNFNHEPLAISDLAMPLRGRAPVIQLIENELLTSEGSYSTKEPTLNFESDIPDDILKIVYINRYTNGKPQIALCKGFNLKRGAIASTISHDSHNILAVGCSDLDLTNAINHLIKNKGGLAVSSDNITEALDLPIAGLISNANYREVADRYKTLTESAQKLGATLRSPFMTLAFLSLVVIPELKLGEKGLFSYSKFNFI